MASFLFQVAGNPGHLIEFRSLQCELICNCVKQKLDEFI